LCKEVLILPKINDGLPKCHFGSND